MFSAEISNGAFFDNCTEEVDLLQLLLQLKKKSCPHICIQLLKKQQHCIMGVNCVQIQQSSSAHKTAVHHVHNSLWVSAAYGKEKIN